MKNKYDELRSLIIKGKDNFVEAEQRASGILGSIDKECEELTQQKGKLQRQRYKKTECQNLQDQLASQQNILLEHQRSLANANTHLQATQAKVNEMHRRMEHDEAVRNAGIGLMFIPFVGTIIGATLVGVYQTDLDNATDAKNQAESEVHNWEGQVASSSRGVSDCQTQINQKTQEISQANTSLEVLRRTIEDVTQQRLDIADVQEKFRNAVRVLTNLAGIATVGEVQTRKFILFEPLMTVLQEIFKCVLQMSDKKGHLQCVETALNPIQSAFEENVRKMKALCDKGDDYW
ncbi:LOW QUALITY PROTEIN: uncharacterized protein LOC125739334 [Brienomyrus brachyistius]|uniref:LOW QUALITY PROTEIN: uncharacterized protein LOC125739334 n=1 Tax=Brienomyrus brachyistius TaxID=42636 RepID=UPI0020B2E3AF|nr:LOW QUALITY PROTEIN: uncharacterized protein LOC125739334 [Brienomyrus brachyistius]